jgi:hypothetical protein
VILDHGQPRFEDLGHGRTRMHVGVNDGYAKVDGLLAAGSV